MTISKGFGERMAGDGQVITPQCHSCKHYCVGTLRCSAFPLGIPQGILSNKVSHTNPVEDDNGIQWQSRSR